MLTPLERAVVRIYSKRGEVVVGAGFLTFQKYILTCTHVIADALGVERTTTEMPSDEVILDFPRVASRQKLKARVVFWRPVDLSKEKEEEDVAGLELIDSLPDEAQPARWAAGDSFSDHEFEAFGFPAGNRNGTWAYGLLRKRTANNRIQIEDVKQTGYRLEPGFSGTPVWDKKLEGVAGIAVSADPKRPEAKVAFIIPADIIIKTWDQLIPQDIICPYQGLYAFQEEDAQFFFGRDRFKAELLEIVDAKQLVTVIGPSGSGKSSLVFAGLIPSLIKQGNWLIDHFRPLTDPFFELAKASIRLMQPDIKEAEQLIHAGRLKQEIQEGRLSAQQIIGSILEKNSGKKLLLVIDQFEELYTLCKEEKQQQLFLDQLLAVVRYIPNFTTVLTLRADFLGYALSYRPFADAIPEADQMLGPMNLEELRDAIQKPIESLATIETGLIERILEDVKQEPGNLPLLEFTLTQLWEKKEYGWLTHNAYDEIGGAEKALAQYAENEYKKLSEADQQRAKRVLIQLVSPGDETQDTRRLATGSEVGYDNWDLITRLASARLVVTGRDDSTKEETVEIIHEALIREWDRLQKWINAERSFRLWQERLQASYRKWIDADQSEDALLQGINVGDAEGWLQRRSEEISSKQESFIRQSIKVRDRKRKRTIYTLIIFSSLVSMLGIAAFISRQAAITALVSQVNALNRSSFVLRDSGQSFDALLTAMRGGKPILSGQISSDSNSEISEKVTESLIWSLFYVRERNRLEGHKDEVWSVSFSPDGELVATTSGDKTVKIWNRQGQEIITLDAHKGLVASVSFSPDSQMIATASQDKTIKLWSRSGDEIETLEGHQDWVYDAKFSPNANLIASASKDKTVRIWDLSGKQIKRFEVSVPDDEGDGGFNTLDFNPSGNRIAASSWDRTIRIWSVEDGEDQEPQTIRGHEDAVNSVDFSSSGEMLVTASRDQTIRIWDLDGQELKRIEGHVGEISDAKFNPDDTSIASAGFDRSIKIWNLDGEELKPSLDGHTAQVSRIAFSPDGETIASAGFDKTARLWAYPRQKITRLTGHVYENEDNNVWGVDFSRDGKFIATGGQDNTAIVWNRDTLSVSTFVRHDDIVTSAKFSPDSQVLATTSKDNTVKLWRVGQGEVENVLTLVGHEKSDDNRVDTSSFSSDGQFIATADWNGIVKIWSADGKEIKSFKAHEDRIYDINYSNDSKTIITASRDQTAKIWDNDGKLIQLLEGHSDQVYNADFSPDGQAILTSSRDGTIKLWNTNGEATKTIEVAEIYPGQVYSARFSPDGRLIAAATRDGRITLWNLSGKLLKIFEGHTDIADNVSFSSDGTLLASASRDDTVILWTLDQSQLQQSLELWSLNLSQAMSASCQWAGGYLKHNINVREDDRQICN